MSFPARSSLRTRCGGSGFAASRGADPLRRAPASRRARAARGHEGVVAVDMESAWLADAAGERPLAVLRVVADTAGRALSTRGSLVDGVRALSALRRAAPALEEWAAAIGPRTVLLAGPRSFCAGVERAIEVVERALAQRGRPIYVRKQIVHNVHVVARARAARRRLRRGARRGAGRRHRGLLGPRRLARR